MDYAVLYRKELLNSSQKTYIMKPCYVIKGFYDEKSNTFLDEMNVERNIYSDPKVFTTDDEYYVGNIYSEETLIEEYSDNESIDSAQLNLFKDVTNYVSLTVYNDLEKSITVLTVTSETFNNREFDIDEYITDEEFYEDGEYEDYDDINDISFEEFYENIKEQIGEDFMVISGETLESIIELKNIDEIRTTLEKIRDDIDIQAMELDNSKSPLFITIKSLNNILNQNSVKEIQNCLKVLLDASNNAIEDYQQKQIDETVDMYEDSINTYNDIYDIKKMYKLIDMQIASYQKALLEEERDSFINFYETCIDRYEQMKKSTDLNEIKMMYASLVEETKDLLYEMMLENSKNYVYNSTQLSNFSNKESNSAKKETTPVESKDKENYMFDYQEVRTKMLKRLIGRDIQVDAILSTIERNDRITNDSKRSAMIIAGTTGTGKTQTYVELSNALSKIRPVNIVDTNQLTEKGYVGGTIEQNVLAPLIEKAHRINTQKSGSNSNAITAADIELASHGIVILDEIDKRSEQGQGEQNVNKSGVVHQLLKLMDQGTKYNVIVRKQSVTFDTSKLTIFASGAFQEYFEEITKKKKHTLGFGDTNSCDKEEEEFSKYNEVDPNKLVEYGLDRQFVGRFNRVLLFPQHTAETLVELENNKATSNIQVEVEQYALKGINLIWEDGYIEEAAKKAYEMKTGGRALSNMINRSLGNLNCEVNNRKGMFETVFVPVSALEDSGNVMLIKKDGSHVFLRDLYKETEIKNRAIKNENKITRNEELYKSALEAYRSRLLELKEEPLTAKVKTL